MSGIVHHRWLHQELAAHFEVDETFMIPLGCIYINHITWCKEIFCLDDIFVAEKYHKNFVLIPCYWLRCTSSSAIIFDNESAQNLISINCAETLIPGKKYFYFIPSKSEARGSTKAISWAIPTNHHSLVIDINDLLIQFLPLTSGIKSK